ncbi:MAG: hypothetical protein IPL23_02765 [Saprospiraceae bacterium]|nr:hypothetical protein [Saprospiraceae bacterium]
MALNPQKQINFDGVLFDFPLIGHHNQKMQVPQCWCAKNWASLNLIFQRSPKFYWGKKRLQVLWNKPQTKGFLDFAHAPSKVKATVTSGQRMV